MYKVYQRTEQIIGGKAINEHFTADFEEEILLRVLFLKKHENYRLAEAQKFNDGESIYFKLVNTSKVVWFYAFKWHYSKKEHWQQIIKKLKTGKE